MKKTIRFMLYAAATAATVSCAEEIIPENSQNNNSSELNLIPMTFTAGAEDADTKIVLQEDRRTIHWESTDRIKVFDGISNDLPAFTTNESGLSVDFSGGVADADAGTYYALYPYQEGATFKETAQPTQGYGNVIKAIVPPIQTAVPNGIHPEAFVAAAKSENGNRSFRFRAICGFVKFQLSEADAADAVAVSLSGNDLGSLAGSVEIYFQNNSGEAFGQTYVSNENTDYVTLTGNFEANTDYYFAIRSNKFANGFTITIKYKDGSSKYVTTMKAPSKQVSRNTVMNIGTPVFKEGLPNDLYIAWQHGLDIDIAGEKFNKTTYGNATQIKKDNEKSVAGVYFVEPKITFTTKYQNVTEPIIVIGRYANQRTGLKINGIQKLDGTKAIVAYKNLNITYDNNNQPFQSISDSRCIVMDNCNFNHIRNTFITATTFSINTVGITNSEIKIDGTYKSAAYIFLSSKDNDKGNSSFTFKNNIVYFVPGETITAMTDFKCIEVKKAGVGNVYIENNIFDNTIIPNDSFAKFLSIDGELFIRNNIFNNVVTTEVTSGLIGNNNSGTTPACGEISGNFYYKSADNTGKFVTRKTGLSTLAKNYNPQLALEQILTDWDPENGEYGIAETITYYNTGTGENVSVNTANVGAKR